MRFLECLKALGHDGELFFRCVADDGQPYDFQMTLDAFIQFLGKGWTASQQIPSRPEADALFLRLPTAELTIRVGEDLQPYLGLTMGPVHLMWPVTAALMARLHQSVLAVEGDVRTDKGTH